MKKDNISKLIGKNVLVDLTDGTTVEGVLHKSKVRKKSFYCMNGNSMSRNLIFGISHIEKVREK